MASQRWHATARAHLPLPLDANNYYYSPTSPVQDWPPRDDGTLVNELNLDDLVLIAAGWLRKRWMILLPSDDWLCTLVPVGITRHPQATISRELRGVLSVDGWGESPQWKEQIHLIWWRLQNGGLLLPRDLVISHIDRDSRVLRLIAESPALNESRKYCHLFGWNDVSGLCPHVYEQCTWVTRNIDGGAV
mmetsp:Transcript_2177/g.5904  ORF Transcript_2177/g.5904 Transcript_2177/m.5904 type:complete len:190 (-) Transcript_2177:723-1292(-)|eukprot:CAMPEP_0185830256 /NCGR_PEP_ID=MMETSP1353-20130828/719_1 /TAXON_ID=1077150 /ORGANISM="Erythrolobus australicus, Strain CCMP3124" /LENGTH=189 /DNA_ID=CAMNT_0028528131 /DNA_START=296 /DNA_END=865 /DNA_ORIENTATION=-